MPRFFCLILIFLLVRLTVNGETLKYDDLLRQSSDWSTARIVSKADSLTAFGHEEEAIVLYMVEVSRNADKASADAYANHIKAHLRTGDIHYGKGNYSDALRYYVAGLKLSEQSEDHPYLAVLYKNMGNVYNMFQDYEKGESLYLSGLREARRVDDNETAYKLLHNLVGVSINLSKVPEARKYYEQSQTVAHEVTDENTYMDRYILALILDYEGRSRESLNRFKELAELSRKSGIEARYECSAYEEIGRIYNQMGRRDSAIYYLTRCKDVAQANGILFQYTEPLKMLYTLYDRMGDRATAAELKDRYLELKDSIYNQRQFDIAKNQQFLYEMEKVEKEIAYLNEKQTNSARLISRQRIILLSVLAAFVLAALMLYWFYRQKKRLTESYGNLHGIYQRMIADHRDSREKELALRRENENLRTELERLGVPAAMTPPEAGDGAAADGGDSGDDAAATASKYERSSLEPLQRDMIAQNITDVMENDKPFCSPEFSLGALAALINSNSKYVSQVINDVFKKNFSTFVNEYRVNLACERLADIDGFGHFSMNGIGDSVGFRSAATFTSVFKKITGITPSIYKKLTYEKMNESLKSGNED